MGVYTFVCRNSGGEWTAKQHSGDLEASAESTYELQRKLVSAALAKDSGVVQSSFSYITPSSAVAQVIVGGAAPAAFVGGGAAAPAAGGAATAEAPKEEKKVEEKEEESDEDMGLGLFD